MFKKIVPFFFAFFFAFASNAQAERWKLSSDGTSAETSGQSKSFNPNAAQMKYSCTIQLLNDGELGLSTTQSGVENFTLTGRDQITSQKAAFIYKKIEEKGVRNTLLENNKSVTWAYKGMARNTFTYQSSKTTEGSGEGFREKSSIAWSHNFNLYEVSNPCFSLIQYLPKGNSPLLSLAYEFNSKFAWYAR
jgi:hypothetical protein